VDVYVEVRAGAAAGADVDGAIFQLSLQSKSKCLEGSSQLRGEFAVSSHPRLTWGRQLFSRPLPLGLRLVRTLAPWLFSSESPSAFAG
jgi:hypothetical protein